MEVAAQFSISPSAPSTRPVRSLADLRGFPDHVRPHTPPGQLPGHAAIGADGDRVGPTGVSDPQTQRDLDATTPATGNVFTGVFIQSSAGAALRINQASCVDNLLTSAVLAENAGGCVSEAVPGMLTQVGVVCR